MSPQAIAPIIVFLRIATWSSRLSPFGIKSPAFRRICPGNWHGCCGVISCGLQDLEEALYVRESAMYKLLLDWLTYWPQDVELDLIAAFRKFEQIQAGQSFNRWSLCAGTGLSTWSLRGRAACHCIKC